MTTLTPKVGLCWLLSENPGRKDPNSPFEGQLDSQFSGEAHKVMNAQAHGAVGLIIIHGSPSSPEREHY